MKERAIQFLRAAFPFLATLFLWRMPIMPWNPAGILAIIPIFYCTFIRPVPWFAPFGILMCFLIDYNFDTLCYWTALYCLAYAANGFQTRMDLTRAATRGAGAFAAFFGTAMLILGLMHLNLSNMLRMIWIFIWTTALYLPATGLIKRIGDD